MNVKIMVIIFVNTGNVVKMLRQGIIMGFGLGERERVNSAWKNIVTNCTIQTFILNQARYCSVNTRRRLFQGDDPFFGSWWWDLLPTYPLIISLPGTSIFGWLVDKVQWFVDKTDSFDFVWRAMFIVLCQWRRWCWWLDSTFITRAYNNANLQ